MTTLSEYDNKRNGSDMTGFIWNLNSIKNLNNNARLNMTIDTFATKIADIQESLKMDGCGMLSRKECDLSEAIKSLEQLYEEELWYTFWYGKTFTDPDESQKADVKTASLIHDKFLELYALMMVATGQKFQA